MLSFLFCKYLIIATVPLQVNIPNIAKTIANKIPTIKADIPFNSQDTKMILILSKRKILINPFNSPIIPAAKLRIPDKKKPIANVKSVGITASQINEEYE